MTVVDQPLATEGILTYTLDPPHSRAHFSVRHMMIAHVRGEFANLSGTLQLNQADPTASKVEVEIKIASIHTNQSQRDAHLLSGDFFDAEKFPTITFVSKSATLTGDDTGKVVGDLTIHGVTREVTLDVEGTTDEQKDGWGNLRLGFTGQTKIKRSDFGLTYNSALETGGVVISDDVSITVDAQFTRPA